MKLLMMLCESHATALSLSLSLSHSFYDLGYEQTLSQSREEKKRRDSDMAPRGCFLDVVRSSECYTFSGALVVRKAP